MLFGQIKGINFIDSTHIKVCNNKRIHQHKVFKQVDDRNIKVMQSLTEDIFGKLFGDKGYISKALSDLLLQMEFN